MLVTKLTAIADAIRGKTGKSEGLTLDQMATEIAGITGGGGMESGELTITGHYAFSVPVSSKKSHILVYPKTIEDSTHNKDRISYFLSVEGLFAWQRRPTNSSYFAVGSVTEFRDNLIGYKDLIGIPYNLGEYYWFAW